MRREAGAASRIRMIVPFIGAWGFLLSSFTGESLDAADSLWSHTSSRVSESSTAWGPSEQSAASVQALAMSGNGTVYAGSFGHGIFRTVDRGTTWARVGGGVTDPFILSLVSTKDGAVYAGTFVVECFAHATKGAAGSRSMRDSNGLKSRRYWLWTTTFLLVLGTACIVCMAPRIAGHP